ncbi:hypothetical protein DSO57_1028621 [Entomophthora muscae]|uniref:Uncharacterized protein n=1 Tax=Entomophthora muscae TaxID=34485 RepID=A0ACC2SR08_9FUNG|nr:hypothetical protein DSO57_1028621 [Entomophthora muscae]
MLGNLCHPAAPILFKRNIHLLNNTTRRSTYIKKQLFGAGCANIQTSAVDSHTARTVKFSERKVINKSGVIYEPMIGLEIHVQINSKRKLFSDAFNEFGQVPNTQVVPFDVAHPGTLPVLNPECVKKAVITILGINGEVQTESFFERKHYFYPDLPHGYQITQKRAPVGRGGKITLGLSDQHPYELSVRIEQVQLEQDTANLVALDGATGINYNRAGAGLMEIVTLPDMATSQEAACFVTKLQSLLRCLGVSDCNLEEGSLRCDVNVSVRKAGESPGTRCELKNLHTPRIIAAAIDAEIIRHISVLESGGKVLQDTRGFDLGSKQTYWMRSKEMAPDYRYMPEPDLPTVLLRSEDIEILKRDIPELPDQTYQRLVLQHGIRPSDAVSLLSETGLVSYFDNVVSFGHPPQIVCNWIVSKLFGIHARSRSRVSAKQLASVLTCVKEGEISEKIAKDILIAMAEGDSRLAPAIILEKGLAMIGDRSSLQPILIHLIKGNSARVAQAAKGDSRAISWFMGQAMRQTSGRANPTILREILDELILETSSR